MKIGTKANAIDDLGKLDTSKTITKVNGKYPQKRYTIVRGQRKCLYYEVISKKCLLDLEDCSKECINIKGKFQYGDTKEQLIKKVAQVLFQREIEIWYEHFPDEKPDKEIAKTLYKNCLEQATKIVEYLGFYI